MKQVGYFFFATRFICRKLVVDFFLILDFDRQLINCLASMMVIPEIDLSL